MECSVRYHSAASAAMHPEPTDKLRKKGGLERRGPRPSDEDTQKMTQCKMLRLGGCRSVASGAMHDPAERLHGPGAKPREDPAINCP
jgi:hypothetical protein